MNKKIEELASRSYPIVVYRDSEGDTLAEVPDLPGCFTHGKTIEEAVSNVEEAKRVWIEIALERGLDVPEPRDMEEEPSGRFLARLPKSLHRNLQQEAERDGVSLNQCLIHVITKGLGVRSMERVVTKATYTLEATAQVAQETLKRQAAFQVQTPVNTAWEPIEKFYQSSTGLSTRTVLILGSPDQPLSQEEEANQSWTDLSGWFKRLPSRFLTHTKGSGR